MKQLFARLLGLDREINQRDYAIRRLNDQIDALDKANREARSRVNYQSKRNADLSELLDAQGVSITAAVESITQARRTLHLKNSGPATAQRHLTAALNALKGEQS